MEKKYSYKFQHPDELVNGNNKPGIPIENHRRFFFLIIHKNLNARETIEHNISLIPRDVCILRMYMARQEPVLS